MGSIEPLIACIMPTTVQRRELWEPALEMFARQEASNSVQLWIGLDLLAWQPWQTTKLKTIADKLGIADRVKVISCGVEEALRGGQTLGAKRNELIAASRAPWIAFWDDDDWHAPERMRLTIKASERATNINSANAPPRPPILIGSTRMLIHEIVDPRRRTFLYEYTGPEAYFIGGTLCFERALWERHRFAETGDGATVGDEAWWQLSAPRDIFRYPLGAPASLYCAFIHKANTANKQAPTGDPCWTSAPELLSVIPRAELRRWEDAHARMLVDRIIDVDDPRDVVGDRERL